VFAMIANELSGIRDGQARSCDTVNNATTSFRINLLRSKTLFYDRNYRNVVVTVIHNACLINYLFDASVYAERFTIIRERGNVYFPVTLARRKQAATRLIASIRQFHAQRKKSRVLGSRFLFRLSRIT